MTNPTHSETTRDADVGLEPYYDAFTRWWVENVGGRPTPDDVRTFRPRLERSGLLKSEQKYAEEVHARMLAKGMPETLVGPFDPRAEIAAAARAGVDISGSPELLVLGRLAETGRRKSVHVLTDPRSKRLAKSLSHEKVLRKAKAKARKARSKVLRHPSRRDPERDRDIVREIHSYLKTGQAVRFTPKRAELVTPSSLSPLLPGTTTGRSTTHDPVIWLPNWEKATLLLHATAIGIAAGNAGYRDFTLHLGDSGIRYAMGVGEMLFARRIYRRITDALAKNCPREGFAA